MKYVLYHANCPDGFGAALAAWLRYKDQATYIPVSYGNPPPKMIPGSEVYIVDFSYAARTLCDMAEQYKQITVLDHHATAKKDLSREAFLELGESHPTCEVTCGGFLLPRQGLQIKFNMTKSGAVLAWEYFHPDEPVPLLFQYLQDRDLWKFELVNSRAVSAYLQTQDMKFPMWEYIMRKMTHTAAMQEIYRAGAACLKLKEQQVEIMAKNGFFMVFDMNTEPPVITRSISPECLTGQIIVPTANATCFFSEVGERLLELYPGAKFSAYYFDRLDGKRQWGMSSRKDFDCSVIAKAFGGGGHKQASGFTQEIKP